MKMKQTPTPLGASVPPCLCAKKERRQFLADVGFGFTGLALGAMLAQDGIIRAETLGTPQRAFPTAPKAKSVIWIFLIGGMSHLESFDPKPELNKHAGKTIDESPHKAIL